MKYFYTFVTVKSIGTALGCGSEPVRIHLLSSLISKGRSAKWMNQDSKVSQVGTFSSAEMEVKGSSLETGNPGF